jgi:hypothetical protein
MRSTRVEGTNDLYRHLYGQSRRVTDLTAYHAALDSQESRHRIFRPVPVKKDVWHIVADLHSLCDGQVVFIGGVAVQALTQKLGAAHGLPSEATHDVDMAVTIAASGALRDKKLLTPNKRLKKAQITVSAVEVDVYVEYQSGLRFDYTELATYAERLSIGKAVKVQIASIGHLVLLKLDALGARASSAHGAKDRRDLAKLFVMGSDRDEDIQIVVGAATGADVSAMQRVLKSTAFTEITRGNAQAASKLRIKAEKFVERVKKGRGAT